MLSRGSAFISLNAAITDTGSVAAISTPKKAAPSQLQPSSQCMPAVTSSAEMATPIKASTTVSGSSSRKRDQRSCSAASKISGGRNTLKISSRDSGRSAPTGRKASAIPASTSPAVYGSPILREIIATSDATISKVPSSGRPMVPKGGFLLLEADYRCRAWISEPSREEPQLGRGQSLGEPPRAPFVRKRSLHVVVHRGSSGAFRRGSVRPPYLPVTLPADAEPIRVEFFDFYRTKRSVAVSADRTWSRRRTAPLPVRSST